MGVQKLPFQARRSAFLLSTRSLAYFPALPGGKVGRLRDLANVGPLDSFSDIGGTGRQH